MKTYYKILLSILLLTIIITLFFVLKKYNIICLNRIQTEYNSAITNPASW